MQFTTKAAAVAAIGALAGSAQAQFITSITQPLFGSNPAEVFFTDTTTGNSELLFDATDNPSMGVSSPGFGGLAADEANRRLFGTVQSGGETGLYSIDYDTLTPTLVGETFLGGDGLSLSGLAYDTNRGVLYGATALGGSLGPEGFFTVDTATGDLSLLFEFETTATSNFTYNALDYDPVTDKVYLVDEDPTGGRSIQSFDPANPAGGLSFVAALPSEFTDVDGLGAGDGKLYLLTDSAIDANNGDHGVYDILSGQFLGGLESPYPAYSDSVLGPINPSGGGAYAPGIPAPGAVGLLAAAGLTASRRRRA